MNRMEAGLWRRVRSGLSPHLYLRRVENLVGEGDPDVYFHNEYGRQGWIELKAKEKPARESTKVFGTRGLRDAQVSRVLELSRCKVPVFILAQASDCLFLVEGRYSDIFNNASLQQLWDFSDWKHVGKMKVEDWAGLAKVLVLLSGD